jgi:hypothetical protein
MKITALLALVALSTGTAFAQSNTKDFLGYYEGVQVGNNSATVSGPSLDTTTKSIYPSIVLGYNMMHNNMLVGIEGFADYHKKSSTGIVAGVTFKAGKIINQTLVYARAGVKGDMPSYRPQVGLGLEHRLTRDMTISGILTHDVINKDGVKRTNNNAAIGLNFYIH